MNLVFIGASRFGLRCLSACLDLHDWQVTGVVTASKTFAISYRPTGMTNVLHADVAQLADTRGIPVRTLCRSMNEPGLLDCVAQWKPDAFLVAGWYHMIPRSWRNLAPAYGLHASMLPDYGGGAPLVWAMINGEIKTGVTLFQMDDGVDSGPIAAQRSGPIYQEGTIATLYARIEERGLELVRETLPRLARGLIKFERQDESKRRIMPQRSPEDGLIDWTTGATRIDRFIRAQTKPYPGAFSSLDNAPIHIWRAEIGAHQGPSVPGEVTRTDDGNFAVGCGQGFVILLEISYEQRTYTQAQLTDVFGGGGSDWANRRAA